MAVTANKKEYKKGYNRNIVASRELAEKNIYSKRMLLLYSIECGLKYLLLDKWEIVDINQIEKDSDRGKLINSHNIKGILKELGYQGMIKFPILKTVHDEKVDVSTYHQVCRYGVSITKDDIEKEKNLEMILNQIANWIIERM